MPAQFSPALCVHCGTPFRATEEQRQYCCSGCQFVHDLIKKNGLGQFYDLRDGAAQPVKSLVFQKRDYSWLQDLVRVAEARVGEPASLSLDLQGVSCIGCVWLIEKLFTSKKGALDLRVDPTLGRLEMRWVSGQLDVISFAREIQSFGYLMGPPAGTAKRGSHSLSVRLGLCGALALNTMLFTLPGYLGMESTFQYATLFARFSLFFSTLSLVIGGSYFFTRTWHSLRQGVLHIDLPISLGLLAAYACSAFAWVRGARGFVYFDFVAIFTFLMLAGRWLQQKAVERNRNLLLATQNLPTNVHRSGSGENLPLAEIVQGTFYSVASGQPIPVRSKLSSPGVALGLEWINGESETIAAPRGRIVPSGAINCSAQAIDLEAVEAWPDSLLARLIEVSPARAHRNLALERFIRAYIVVVLGLGLLALGAWWWITGNIVVALQVFSSVLVVSCPCASGVALPLADDLAASTMRRAGVFIREASLWLRLERVRKIIFDKTGTLTLETMALRNPEALADLLPGQKSVLLAMVGDSPHPVSCCLRELLLADGIEPAAIPRAEETVGVGLEVVADRQIWLLGRNGWAGEADGDCIFSRNGRVLAAFRFHENVRADAVEEIAALRARGLAVFILSGDRREKVEAMAARLGLPPENCHAEMSPQQKADWVCQIDARDTLLIGDGANDSLAFDAADCTGTPAIDRGLLERKADFYFLGRGLVGVRRLFETAVCRRRTVRRVITFAVVYNAAAIGLSLAGAMSPVFAAVLMPLSSLVSLAIVFAGRPR
ncbi:MAG: heavy metal translocating P-type ATPase metal-binding domain-containing protein [Chthoniobacter sp.]|nr:heavy metal translocating P-type ATPase metal-binding domain-containing protein [Chthoniobacter sp.]